jgi:hypothetical protein
MHVGNNGNTDYFTHAMRTGPWYCGVRVLHTVEQISKRMSLSLKN